MDILLALFLILPPQDVKVFDTPNDDGESITIQWKLSPVDTLLRGYEIFRCEVKEGPFESVGFVMRGENQYEDKNVKDGKKYYYYVSAVGLRVSAKSEIVGPVVSAPQWFNLARLNVLLFVLIFGFLVVYYIEKAKKHREKMYLRKIPGLDAIDDAVGRATELGRPILFSFGLGALIDVVTIAALSILRRIARKTAEYGVKLLIPNYDPIVMAAAQETVRQAYTEKSRPDLYREEDITFLTADQFGYAAGVDGIMMREKPGAIFLQGYFYAESLILAETGYSVGAIQIAGTTAITQLPFFIAACDYTLIGEEMYAASAYLDRDPPLLGSIKGEDIAKASIILIIVSTAIIGTLGYIFSTFFGKPFFENLYQQIIDLFKVS